jgi:hypothetical protein
LYYIKIFLYQIDLEKSSYEYINVLFKNYYEGLKRYTFKNYRNMNKSKREIEQDKFKSYISDLHNADFLIYYYLYYIYFAKILEDDVIINNQYDNKKLKKYTNIIYDEFMDILMQRLKSICIIDKRKKIINKLNFDRKQKLLNVFPILLRFEQKKKLEKFEYDILDEFQIEEFEKSKDKKLKNYFYLKKKEYNYFLNKLFFKKQNKIDQIFFKNLKFEFLDLVFFFAKKINFKKYKSMQNLDNK